MLDIESQCHSSLDGGRIASMAPKNRSRALLRAQTERNRLKKTATTTISEEKKQQDLIFLQEAELLRSYMQVSRL